MKTNELPHYDDSVNTTGCCPKFNPNGWNARNLHFESKPFMRATTRSRDHVPLDMAEVFEGSYEKTQDWYREMEELVRARGGG